VTPAGIILGTLGAYAALWLAVLAMLEYSRRQELRDARRQVIRTRLRRVVARDQDCRRAARPACYGDPFCSCADCQRDIDEGTR
jgi:hypothetical protein